jgi:phosphatidylglycerol:prolipoprotein diacylglycerol transferase
VIAPVYPVLLSLGPVAVYSWGAMLGVAFVACWLLARWYLPLRGVDKAQVLDLVLAAAAGGLVGARTLYVAANWSVFAANPLWVFMLQKGGMVFYGGLVGGGLAVLAYVLVRRLPVPQVADAAALALPLGSAIGRVGCFLNGCCGGRETAGLFGVTFPGGAGPVVPTQLVDSAANLLIFAAVLHIAVRLTPRAGLLWWTFLALYGVSRFIVEGLRTTPHLALGLTQAQWISLPVAIAGIGGLFWMSGHGRAAVAGGDDG